MCYPLGDAYCVTDYFAEGMSFKDECWLAHLVKPDRGDMKRATLLVMMTRFRDWGKFMSWGRLWPEDASEQERDAVVGKYVKIATASAGFVREWRRLLGAAEHTQAAFSPRLAQLIDEA